jgi:hypothetical protein
MSARDFIGDVESKTKALLTGSRGDPEERLEQPFDDGG